MENWSTFFQAAKPKHATGTVTLTSTTDTQNDVDSAAAGHRRPNREPSFFYARQGPGHVLPDGGTEHSELQTVTHLSPARPGPGEAVDVVGPLSPEQQAAALSVYESQLAAARSAYPDFEEVAQTQEQIAQPLSRVILAWVPNGTTVVRYLAQHPSELHRLNSLVEKGFMRTAQRQTEELAVKLGMDGSVGMDQDDYRTYRQKRDFQVRSRR